MNEQQIERIAAGAVLVVLVALFALWIALGGGSSPYLDQTDARSNSQQAHEDNDSSDERLALEREATSLFDEMKDLNDDFVVHLAASLDEGFLQTTGYHHADLGLDPRDVARWLLDGFDYDITDVSLAGNEGSVSLVITHRDGSALLSDFYNRAYDFFSSPESTGLDETAARARMGELYRASMDATTAKEDVDAHLDFTLENGRWRVDNSEFDDLEERLFGIFEQNGSKDADGTTGDNTVNDGADENAALSIEPALDR